MVHMSLVNKQWYITERDKNKFLSQQENEGGIVVYNLFTLWLHACTVKINQDEVLKTGRHRNLGDGEGEEI